MPAGLSGYVRKGKRRHSVWAAGWREKKAKAMRVLLWVAFGITGIVIVMGMGAILLRSPRSRVGTLRKSIDSLAGRALRKRPGKNRAAD